MHENMTAKEIAEALKVTTAMVNLWQRQGIIPALKLGHRTTRYNLNDVLAALKARQVSREHADAPPA